MLPSLALALLCLLQAGAEVPVQPGFNADKVTVQRAHPAGGAAWGRVPAPSTGSPPGQLPGCRCLCKTGLVPASSCPLWPDSAVALLQGHKYPGLL